MGELAFFLVELSGYCALWSHGCGRAFLLPHWFRFAIFVRRKGARLSRSGRQGQRADSEGGEAGQEEEAPGEGSQADAVQPPVRHRR